MTNFKVRMPQFRLTAKMAKALKVVKLGNPTTATPLYDNWYLDVVTVLSMKVYVFMHTQTKVAVAILGYEIGGIKGLFIDFASMIRQLFDFLEYENIAEEAYNYFSCDKSQMNFTKANDKSTEKYLSEFIHALQIEAHECDMINQQICDSVSQYWLDFLLKDKSTKYDYTTPLKLMNNLFDKSLRDDRTYP